MLKSAQPSEQEWIGFTRNQKLYRQTNQRIDRLMEFNLVEVDQQDYVLIQNMIPGFSS